MEKSIGSAVSAILTDKQTKINIDTFWDNYFKILPIAWAECIKTVRSKRTPGRTPGENGFNWIRLPALLRPPLLAIIVFVCLSAFIRLYNTS